MARAKSWEEKHLIASRRRFAPSLEQILRKHKPTLDDIGRLRIMDLCLEFQQHKDGVPLMERKPIITAERLQTLVSKAFARTTPDSQEAMRYLHFVNLYQWTKLYNVTAMFMTARAFHDARFILFYVEESVTIENLYAHIQATQAILVKNDEATGGEIMRDYDEVCRVFNISHFLEPPAALHEYDPSNEDYMNEMERIGALYASIAQGYYYGKGFNIAVDLIGEYINVPEYSVAKIDLTNIETIVRMMNDTIEKSKNFMRDLSEIKLTPPTANRLRTLEEFFPTVNLDVLTPAPGTIDAARKYIQNNLMAFHDIDSTLSNILCSASNDEIRRSQQ